MLEFRTLGTAMLSADGAGVIRLQPKLLALLAYLATERAGVATRRDALLGLLWPEMDEARARNALSQAVHRLRRHLPDEVVVARGNEEIQLRAGRLRCDAPAFEAAAADHRPAVALRLYGGEFLHGFHLSHSADFQRWLDRKREHYRRVALGAALLLADGAARAREWPVAEQLLRHALDIEPSSSPAMERLVQCLAASGDVATATETYGRFVRWLEAEFSVEPARSLADLLHSAPASTATSIRIDVARTGEPADRAAYRAYVRGLHLRGTFSGLQQAIGCFGEAIELDPAFAAAHAGLAICLGTQALLAEVPPGRAHARMRRAVERAIALDEELTDAHTARGLLLLYFERDWIGATAALRRALILRPDDAHAHAYHACGRAIVGAHDEAVAHAERALELEPLDPWTNFVLGWVRYRARDWSGALAQLRELLQLYPHYALAHLFAGEALLASGRAEEAVAACDEGLALLPANQLMVGIAACVIGLAGHPRRAATLLESLERLAKEGYVDPLYRAAAVYGTGDRERALDILDAGERQLTATIHLIGSDPLYDGLKDDERFRRICHRLGLPH